MTESDPRTAATAERRRTVRTWRWLGAGGALCLLTAAALGCQRGGGAPAAGEAATTGAEQPATKRASAIALLGLTPPEQPWAQMGFKDREMYMIGKVLPIAEEIFEQHDPKRFANFQCEDCHGEDMKARNYAMPSPTMFAVPEPGTDAYARMTKAYPDMVPFMEHTVTPTIGQILGVQPFTCADCHPKPR